MLESHRTLHLRLSPENADFTKVETFAAEMLGGAPSGAYGPCLQLWRRHSGLLMPVGVTDHTASLCDFPLNHTNWGRCWSNQNFMLQNA